VNDAAIPAGLMPRKGFLLFENGNLATGPLPKEGPGYGQANDAAADYNTIKSLHGHP
jgi:hypothetical protein